MYPKENRMHRTTTDARRSKAKTKADIDAETKLRQDLFRTIMRWLCTTETYEYRGVLPAEANVRDYWTDKNKIFRSKIQAFESAFREKYPATIQTGQDDDRVSQCHVFAMLYETFRDRPEFLNQSVYVSPDDLVFKMTTTISAFPAGPRRPGIVPKVPNLLDKLLKRK